MKFQLWRVQIDRQRPPSAGALALTPLARPAQGHLQPVQRVKELRLAAVAKYYHPCLAGFLVPCVARLKKLTQLRPTQVWRCWRCCRLDDAALLLRCTQAL